MLKVYEDKYNELVALGFVPYETTDGPGLPLGFCGNVKGPVDAVRLSDLIVYFYDMPDCVVSWNATKEPMKICFAIRGVWEAFIATVCEQHTHWYENGETVTTVYVVGDKAIPLPTHVHKVVNGIVQEVCGHSHPSCPRESRVFGIDA